MKPQSAKSKTILANANNGTTQLFVGPMPRGPKRCIKCGKEFKNGDAWKRVTAPDDPKYGTYSIGIHVKCVSK